MDIQDSRLVAGRYRLLFPLGSGGMGTVWRALDEVLGREVAVKEVSFPRGVSDGERTVLYERTRREARAAARLDDASAVTVFDVVEQDGAPYLVMELVEAPTLAEVVRRDGPLSPERTAEVGLALLGALEAAHRQGIVHRDVKPSNVLMRDDGRVVLTDFGIASTTGDSSLTHTGLLLGSPAYMAPERARGEATGPPADLWSLGATLFTAVEGRPPFEGDDALVTVSAVVTGEHAPYVAAGPLVPVLNGLLVKDPAHRVDVTGARRLLQGVVDAGGSRTKVLAPPIVDMTQADSSTAVLNARQVLEEIGGAEAQPEHDQRYDIYEPTPLPVAPGRASRPPARRGIRGKRGSRVLPAALVAVLATAGAGYALTRDDAPGPGVAGSATTPGTSASASGQAPPPTRTEDREPERTSEPTTAAPEASAETTEEERPATPDDETDLPEGWSSDTGGAGWRVALPPGYTQASGNQYRGDNGRTLRIDTGPGQPDAVADRESQARTFARRHPSYQEIRIEPVDYRGYEEAADWEFTYEGLHVINRVFVVDGTGHSLFFQTRAGDFADARADFDRIAEEFQPVEG